MAPLPPPPLRTVEAIFAWHAARRSSYRSAGIAVSELGTECDRALWYRLRWAEKSEPIEGRKARLFDTGDREETRLVEELRAIGVEVFDRDENDKQWPLRAAGEHVRGKADGVVLNLPDAPKTPHLLEIKSHSGKNFKALVKAGVAAAFPKHYAQCQIGMHALGLTRALYIAACKDTDEIHGERLEHDVEFCLRALSRAERIVYSDRAPVRLHDDPKSKPAFACNWCPAKALCHEGEWADAHCRSCLHAEPRPGGAWHCVRWNRDLSLDEQRAGCPAHLFLPDLVPGEQTDADPAAETVTYRLADGTTWIDGARDNGRAV